MFRVLGFRVQGPRSAWNERGAWSEKFQIYDDTHTPMFPITLWNNTQAKTLLHPATLKKCQKKENAKNIMKNKKKEKWWKMKKTKKILQAQEKRGGKKRKECLKGYSPRQAQKFIFYRRTVKKHQTQKKSDFEHPKKTKETKNKK